MAITFRGLKGTALSHPEMDTNLASYYLSSSVSGSTINFYQSGSDGNVITTSHTLTDLTGSDTTYSAGTGLTLTGTEFSLTEPHFSGEYTDLLNTPDVSLTIDTNTHILTLTKLDGTTNLIELEPYLDEDARAIASGTLDGATGIVTFTRDEGSTFTLDLSALLDGSGLVTSVNGLDGIVELDTDDIAEGTTNFYDKVVSLTGQNITINGTYPNFQLTGSATVTETDPIFTAHTASSITSTQIGNWNEAHGWGDHSQAGYLTSYSELDTLQSVTTRGSSTTTTITAANFITTSDKRLKSDIKPIQEGLETIKKFVSYEYVKDGIQDAGFLAQEVQEAIPYSIGEREDGLLTMRDRPVLAHMHKAILELEARLAAIEEKLQ